jgi:hypothetical protein
MIGKPWAFAEPCVQGEMVERLEISLAVQESNKSKNTIKFILTLTNPSTETIFLCFSSAKKYDFIVSKSGREVWRWSSGKLFSQVLLEKTLKPKEALQFTQAWEHKDSKGASVPPGDYEVVGILYSHPEFISSPVTFRVSP